MKYFVTGIDTDSGKTLVSAILCEALEADYWKPIQAGLPKDSDTVKSLLTNATSQIHPERFVLTSPMSPHAAAKIDNVSITVDDFTIPGSDRLIIEGAGGCMVPINDEEFIIDMIVKFRHEVILVADLYLGSINHSILTIEALQRRGIKIKGIVFNGPSNPESERIILNYGNVPCLLRIARENVVDKSTVRKYAAVLKKNL